MYVYVYSPWVVLNDSPSHLTAIICFVAMVETQPNNITILAI